MFLPGADTNISFLPKSSGSYTSAVSPTTLFCTVQSCTDMKRYDGMSDVSCVRTGDFMVTR